jgi:hypothetical protein
MPPQTSWMTIDAPSTSAAKVKFIWMSLGN